MPYNNALTSAAGGMSVRSQIPVPRPTMPRMPTPAQYGTRGVGIGAVSRDSQGEYDYDERGREGRRSEAAARAAEIANARAEQELRANSPYGLSQRLRSEQTRTPGTGDTNPGMRGGFGPVGLRDAPPVDPWSPGGGGGGGGGSMSSLSRILARLPQPAYSQPWQPGPGPTLATMASYQAGAQPTMRSMADRSSANRAMLARVKDELGEYGEGAQRSLREQLSVSGRTGSGWEGREMGRLSGRLLGEQAGAVRDVAAQDLAASEDVSRYNTEAMNRYRESEAARVQAYGGLQTQMSQYNADARNRYASEQTASRAADRDRQMREYQFRMQLAAGMVR